MALEERFDFATAEPRLQARWAALGIYQFDPHAAAPPFTIDTPPPTVSGQIHIGHVYSYTQLDIAARYQRMRGHAVFYPFGFDDNGLPTERFTEASRGISARAVGRDAFIAACLAVSAETEEQFERFWKRLGLSVDWRLRYSTIDDRSRRIAQANFLDLLARGQVERREAPTLWCPECMTAVAQADVDDKEGVPADFVTLAFPTADGRAVPIATSRPELLPACVAVFVHPDDARYRDLVGATAVTPLFGLPVSILADPGAQREKGTGAVMCCTFGDVTDVRWWYAHGLPLRLAITADGRMTEPAGPYAGLPIRAARARILDELAQRGLILERQAITHTIGVHERCGTPIEYLVARQWFINILAHKERLLEAGRAIAWHPPYMRARYESWVEGLTWDWNISRRRFYGVPFPIWYCRDCGAVIPAARETLPMDPTASAPPAPCAACGGSAYEPETDVMDTWATSSLTPRICASLAADRGLAEEKIAGRFAPMALRSNAHDIIRTWDFYTIAQSLLRTGEIPWRAVQIAGHAQDPGGKKLSKSKRVSAEDPTALIERYSADAVRYWTAGVRAGGDTMLSEEAFRQGRRLATKLWNAARFVLAYDEGDDQHRDTETQRGYGGEKEILDRWLLDRLGRTIERATAAMEEYELAAARGAIERFFWSDFCDLYLELVKYRLRPPMNETADPANQAGDARAQPKSSSTRDVTDTEATDPVSETLRTPSVSGYPLGVICVDRTPREAAIATLRAALLAVLKLLAPYLPHVTEEIYLRGFAAGDDASIHRERWPDAADFPADAEATEAGELMIAVVEAVRRWKAERRLSVGAPLPGLIITCEAGQVATLRAMEADLRGISRAARIILASGEGFAVAIENE